MTSHPTDDNLLLHSLMSMSIDTPSDPPPPFILSQPHFTHKSMYVRELILHTIMRLQEWYGDDLMVLPDLCAKVGGLLGDATPSVRQAASHTLVNLFQIFGDSLLSELEESGEQVVSGTQLKLIKQAIRTAETNGYPVVTLSVEGGMDGNNNTPRTASNPMMIGDDDEDDDFGLSRGILLGGVTPTGHVSSIPSPSLDLPPSSSTRPNNATPTNHTTATATNITTNTRPPSSTSSSSSSGRGVTPSTLSTTNNNNNNNNNSSSTPTSGIAITTSDPALTSAPATTPTSAFHPSAYMTLLAEGPSPKIVSIYCEKDLTQEMNKVIQGLNNVDDWQARISALGLLQGIAVGG